MTVLPHIKSMEFCSNDFSTSYGFAERFAGTGGHIATLPEIISARAKEPVEEDFWNTWFTTASAEYVGMSRGGVSIIIVAHGVGPMATLAGIEEAYRPRKFRSDNRPEGFEEGVISAEEFRLLEDGHYGEVDIIEVSKVLEVYPGADYTEPAPMSIAERDPLLQARLGKDWRRVLEMMERETNEMEQERHPRDGAPLVIDNSGALGYWREDHRKGRPFIAHLLTIGRPMNFNGRDCYFEVNCSQRGNTKRFIGVRPEGDVAETHTGPSRINHRKDALVVPIEQPGTPRDFVRIQEFGAHWFTMTPKQDGETIDTAWPEYPVSEIKVVGQGGQAIEFDPNIFFRYDIEQVRAQAPSGANAYYVDSDVARTKIKGREASVAHVVFCQVVIDPKKRAVSEEDFDASYDLQMSLLEQLELSSAPA